MVVVMAFNWSQLVDDFVTDDDATVMIYLLNGSHFGNAIQCNAPASLSEKGFYVKIRRPTTDLIECPSVCNGFLRRWRACSCVYKLAGMCGRRCLDRVISCEDWGGGEVDGIVMG